MVVANDWLLKRERWCKQLCQSCLLENVDAHNLQNFVHTFLQIELLANDGHHQVGADGRDRRNGESADAV